MLIGELFGTHNHKLVRSISSSGKYMFIDFKMQHAIYSGNGIEFEASIKYNKIDYHHIGRSLYSISWILVC